MRPIDATRLVKLVLEERDKIPLTVVERYSFGYPSPYKHGQSMRGGIRKVLRLIEQAPTLDIAPKWISVKERLPEDDENLRFYDDGQIRFASVLVRDDNRGTAIANRLMIRHHRIPSLDELATDGWVWSRPHEPTHWMPLPEPPQEG